MPPKKKVHLILNFRFTSMCTAGALKDAIASRGIRAELTWIRGGWVVETTSECFAHAEFLNRFIYGGAA